MKVLIRYASSVLRNPDSPIKRPLKFFMLLSLPLCLAALSAAVPNQPTLTGNRPQSSQKPQQKNVDPDSFQLLPIPKDQEADQIGSLLQKQRNPFATPGSAFPADPLPAGLKLTGFVKIGAETSALIATAALGENSFSVGQPIGNGYRLVNISQALSSVVVSNGTAQHVLSLPK